jgi:hypothetical protein
MGNGVIDDICDVVYIDPDKFNNQETMQMAEEIDSVNERMVRENRKYLLIGPGRWGSRDRFIGIPVVWPQISNAMVIVETDLPNFHLDASLGSHFFHNVTSMNVGYFSVNLASQKGKVNWKKIREQEMIEKGRFFNHVRFSEPLVIRMDGKRGVAVITTSESKDLI